MYDRSVIQIRVLSWEIKYAGYAEIDICSACATIVACFSRLKRFKEKKQVWLIIGI